jgi:hypothetical protein
MTREDVLRFAHLSKITNPDDGQIKFGQPTAKCLEQFANLVAAAEREACALIADEEFGSTLMIGDAHPKHSSAWRIAAAIRGRKAS